MNEIKPDNTALRLRAQASGISGIVPKSTLSSAAEAHDDQAMSDPKYNKALAGVALAGTVGLVVATVASERQIDVVTQAASSIPAKVEKAASDTSPRVAAYKQAQVGLPISADVLKLNDRNPNNDFGNMPTQSVEVQPGDGVEDVIEDTNPQFTGAEGDQIHDALAQEIVANAGADGLQPGEQLSITDLPVEAQPTSNQK